MTRLRSSRPSAQLGLFEPLQLYLQPPNLLDQLTSFALPSFLSFMFFLLLNN
jgi:hypothetical protein